MKRLIDKMVLLKDIENYCGDYFCHDEDSFDKTAVRIQIGLAPEIDVIDPAVIDTLEKIYNDVNVSKFTSVACCTGYMQGIRDCINILKGVELEG